MADLLTEAFLKDCMAKGMVDHEIGALTGVSRIEVGKRRRELELGTVGRRGGNTQRLTSDQVVAWHAEGMTDVEMAHVGRVTFGTVRRCRERLGLPEIPLPKRAISDDDVRACHAKGMGDREAAARLLCREETFGRRRAALGLEKHADPVWMPEGQEADEVEPEAPCAPEPAPILKAAVRKAFALTPSDPRILKMLEPLLASEMAGAV